MGQYYKIVNLDKEQYLNPHKFGCGLKLVEFTGCAHGPLEALGILLAHSNGRGGGDIAIHNDVDFLTNEERSLIGSWAGDRIVTAGDYDDAWLWVPKKLKGKKYSTCCYGFDGSRVSVTIPFGKRFSIPGVQTSKLVDHDENLYNAAEIFFEDISDRIISAIGKAEAKYGHPWAAIDGKDDGWRNTVNDGEMPEVEPKKPVAGKKAYNLYKKYCERS